MTVEKLKTAIANIEAYLSESPGDDDTVTLTANVIRSIKENYEELLEARAEIERLTKLLDDKCDRCIAKERTEAVKGFAEIVKANLDDFYYTGEDGLVETGALIDILVNQELRGLNNVQCATKKLHVGTVEKTRALFQAMVNKFMSIKDLYVIVDGEYLPWEPGEEVENLFGMSISGDNDETDKETDRVVKELVGDDNG